MTRFLVEWNSAAENALAQIWMDATDPKAVTDAQDAIDRKLASNPVGDGEHVREGLYRIIVSPLVAYYSVDDAARKVEVEGVGTIS
jgi:hypothetical protein